VLCCEAKQADVAARNVIIASWYRHLSLFHLNTSHFSKVLCLRILLVYPAESVSTFCHQSFWQNSLFNFVYIHQFYFFQFFLNIFIFNMIQSSAVFSCSKYLVCTDCILYVPLDFIVQDSLPYIQIVVQYSQEFLGLNCTFHPDWFSYADDNFGTHRNNKKSLCVLETVAFQSYGAFEFWNIWRQQPYLAYLLLFFRLFINVISHRIQRQLWVCVLYYVEAVTSLNLSFPEWISVVVKLWCSGDSVK
jgi:hypothetical protein